LHPDRKRIVADLVAHGVEQLDRLADRHGLGADHARDEIAHEAMIKVEEGGRREIGRSRLGEAVRREDHLSSSVGAGAPIQPDGARQSKRQQRRCPGYKGTRGKNPRSS
jgi:hypothetical protein